MIDILDDIPFVVHVVVKDYILIVGSFLQLFLRKGQDLLEDPWFPFCFETSPSSFARPGN